MDLGAQLFLDRAVFAVPQANQLGNVAKLDAQALGTLDEGQTGDATLVIATVTGVGTSWRGEYSGLLVVAQRGGRDTGLVGQLRDGQVSSWHEK